MRSNYVTNNNDHASLGIMWSQLKSTLKPLEYHSTMVLRCLRGSLNTPSPHYAERNELLGQPMNVFSSLAEEISRKNFHRLPQISLHFFAELRAPLNSPVPYCSWGFSGPKRCQETLVTRTTIRLII